MSAALEWTSQPGDPDRRERVVAETHDRIRLSAYLRPDGEWHVSAQGSGQPHYRSVSTAAFLRGTAEDAMAAATTLVDRVRRMLAAGAA